MIFFISRCDLRIRWGFYQIVKNFFISELLGKIWCHILAKFGKFIEVLTVNFVLNSFRDSLKQILIFNFAQQKIYHFIRFYILSFFCFLNVALL